MIESIDINNFKSLKETKLKLGNFNLLCGTNSSGKSSLIQAILLIAQNHSGDSEIMYNGELITLGDFIEIKNFDMGVELPVSIIIKSDCGSTSTLRFGQDGVIEKSINFPTLNKDFYYLAANRIGNADVFDRASKKNNFGILGEYAISFLDENKDVPMPSGMIYDKSEDTAHLFIDEVNYWMKKITGSTLKVEKIQKTNKLVLSYSNNKNYFVRTSNTGIGLSYVVSIIILGLGVGLLKDKAENMPTVVIENPEIHLHPKAQATLTVFLAWLSNFMQIITETHSDHIFNGYRKMIKNEVLSVENSNLFFFNLQDNATVVKRIPISSNGKLLTLEKDLFDQFQIDLSEMLRK